MRRPSPGLASQCEGLTTEEGTSFPMDTENRSATTPAESRVPAKNHPAGYRPAGVVHEHVRHTENFTVIGNDLAQHPELSLLAIGLACHIQSVRPGTAVDIKTLAARFPEGPTRIAAALRELETHGYLRRSRERTATGRIVTRTVSCNRPGHRAAAREAPPRRPARRTTPDEPAPASASPPSRSPRTRPPPSSARLSTSWRACAVTTPACCCRRPTRNTWPPGSPPGWSGTSPPRPYARP